MESNYNPYTLPCAPSFTIEEEEEEPKLTPKHRDLLRRLQTLFPEANIDEDFIQMRNRGGWVYAEGVGISYRRVTSSYADGPEFDYSKEIAQILCNSGFEAAGYYTSGCDERNFENHETFYYIEISSIKYL